MTHHSEHSASATTGAVDHHDHGSVNQTPLLLKVFGSLCVLTAVSFAIANSPLMNSKTLGWTLMLGVSCAKAFLVIAYFMHLKWERAWKYALTLPTLSMAIFLVVALVPDIAMRSGLYAESRWRHATEGAVVDHHDSASATTAPATTAPNTATPTAATPGSDESNSVNPEPSPADSADQQ